MNAGMAVFAQATSAAHAVLAAVVMLFQAAANVVLAISHCACHQERKDDRADSKKALMAFQAVCAAVVIAFHAVTNAVLIASQMPCHQDWKAVSADSKNALIAFQAVMPACLIASQIVTKNCSMAFQTPCHHVVKLCNAPWNQVEIDDQVFCANVEMSRQALMKKNLNEDISSAVVANPVRVLIIAA